MHTRIDSPRASRIAGYRRAARREKEMEWERGKGQKESERVNERGIERE